MTRPLRIHLLHQPTPWTGVAVEDDDGTCHSVFQRRSRNKNSSGEPRGSVHRNERCGEKVVDISGDENLRVVDVRHERLTPGNPRASILSAAHGTAMHLHGSASHRREWCLRAPDLRRASARPRPSLGLAQCGRQPRPPQLRPAPASTTPGRPAPPRPPPARQPAS